MNTNMNMKYVNVSTKYASIVVHGKVQGVGYRRYVTSKARMCNIKGYAKNLEDGSVEIVAEGDELNVDTFISYLRTGTTMSEISHLDIAAKTTAEYSDFKML